MFERMKNWSVWSSPRPLLAMLLTVEALAVIGVIGLYQPLGFDDLALAGSAIAMSAAYSWATLKWEGTRDILVAGGKYRIAIDLLATWCFFAAVLVPVPLAAVVVVVTKLVSLPSLRLVIPPPLYPYRLVYNIAGLLLAVCLANVCMRFPLPWPCDLGLAALAYICTTVTAIVIAVALSGARSAVRTLLAPRNLRVEVVTMAIAIGQVLLVKGHLAMLLWLSVPLALFLQRNAVRVELKREIAASEQPMVAEAWQVVAREVVRASAAAAVLRIDTGAAEAVAEVARVQAGCDAIGQNGPNGLAILLTDCPGPNADAIAARMRSALKGNKIEGHVAVAAKPRDGQTLADLLAVSEAELIAIQAASQDEGVRPQDA